MIKLSVCVDTVTDCSVSQSVGVNVRSVSSSVTPWPCGALSDTVTSPVGSVAGLAITPRTSSSRSCAVATSMTRAVPAVTRAAVPSNTIVSVPSAELSCTGVSVATAVPASVPAGIRICLLEGDQDAV